MRQAHGIEACPDTVPTNVSYNDDGVWAVAAVTYRDPLSLLFFWDAAGGGSHALEITSSAISAFI